MTWKPSRFAFTATAPGGTTLLHSGVTGALVELDDAEAAAWAGFVAGRGDLDQVTAEALAAFGLVVADDVDEVDRLLDDAARRQAAPPVLELTVAPTYQCNFRCEYCYVHFEDGRMSQEVADRVVRLVEQQAPHHEAVHITWFGGEPLLELATVEGLAVRLRDVGVVAGVPVRQFLTTNGYLLTSEVARRLVGSGVTYFHVTLDGTPESHDVRRFLRSGRPTHERVLGNVLDVLAQVPEAGVTVRMNLEEATVATAFATLSRVPSEQRHRVQVHATPIIRAGHRSAPDLHQQVATLLDRAFVDGFAYYDNALPVGRGAHCSAESRSAFQVGPDGRLHKCSPSGKPDVTVGRITELGLPAVGERAAAWHAVGQCGDGCRDCEFLCFCYGGCRWERLRGQPDPSCRDRFAALPTNLLTKWRAAGAAPALASP